MPFLTDVTVAVQQALAAQQPLCVFVSDGLAEMEAWGESHSGGGVALRVEAGLAQCGLFAGVFGPVHPGRVYVVEGGKVVEVREMEGGQGAAMGAGGLGAEAPVAGTPAAAASGVASAAVPAVATPATRAAPATPAARASSSLPVVPAPATAHTPRQAPLPQPPRPSTRNEEQERIQRLLAADRQERLIAEREARKSRLETPGKPTTPPPRPAVASNTTLLHIKLLDSSTLTGTFTPSTLLAEVRAWVDETRHDGTHPYAFHRLVPRATFTPDQEQQTLAALDLVPRSALLLRPAEPPAITNIDINGGRFWNSLLGMWTWVWGRNEDLLPEPLSPPPLPRLAIHSPLSLSTTDVTRTATPDPPREPARLPLAPALRAPSPRLTHNGNALDLADDE